MSKVLVVTDQPVLASGLSHVLERQGFEIVSAGTRPDLILLDITAGLSIGSVREVRARTPECPVVLWSDTLPLEYLFKTLEHGVRGVVRRTTPPDSLSQVLRKVAGGEMQIGFATPHHASPVKKQVSLTPRERELIGRLSRGLRNKQIAAEMNITEGTVKIYLFRLFHKLGVRNRLELARCGAPGTEDPHQATGRLM